MEGRCMWSPWSAADGAWLGVIERSYRREVSARHEQPLDRGAQAGADEDGIQPQQRSQPVGGLQAQQAPHVRGGQYCLRVQQQAISPCPEVPAVFGVQGRGAVAVQQVPPQVTLTVDLPLRIRAGQLENTQALADSAEHIVQ